MIRSDAALAVVGAALIVMALSSRLVKRHALSPMVLALIIGLAVGPHAVAWWTPAPGYQRACCSSRHAGSLSAFSVFDIALRVRPEDLRANVRRVVVLLLVAMPTMWAVTALGAHLLLGLPLALALLLAACLTPTDPGVASALVSGVQPNRSLPRRLRMSLQIEAAANDGLALPLVLLAGTLLTIRPDEVVATWLSEVFRQLGMAVVVGAAFGCTAAPIDRDRRRRPPRRGGLVPPGRCGCRPRDDVGGSPSRWYWDLRGLRWRGCSSARVFMTDCGSPSTWFTAP